MQVLAIGRPIAGKFVGARISRVGKSERAEWRNLVLGEEGGNCRRAAVRRASILPEESGKKAVPLERRGARAGAAEWRGLGPREFGGRRGNCAAAGAGDGDVVAAEEEGARYDAILVLAGGQVEGGGVPAWVERRLDKAVDLLRRSGGGDGACKIVCVGGGTPHRAPVLSSRGFVVHESAACAAYLRGRGARPSQVVKEWSSYDTIGNGYFALTQHAIPRRWRAMAVVTSDFHMPRARAVFEWIFGLQGAGIAVRRTKGDGHPGCADGGTARGSRAEGFRLEFHSAADTDVMPESVIQARLERERQSLKNLNRLIHRIHNLEDFHEWFHTEHKAYNAEHQHLFGMEEDLPALLSY